MARPRIRTPYAEHVEYLRREAERDPRTMHERWCDHVVAWIAIACMIATGLLAMLRLLP